MSTPAEDLWHDALVSYEKVLRSGGFSDATIVKRLRHARRLADSMTMSPWDVEHADRKLWIQNVSDQRHAQLDHRTSLRHFYRWAFKTGRIFTDPSEEPSRRATAREMPEAWIAPLKGYRGYLRAAGRPETTVQMRLFQLRAFAYENASLAPYETDMDDLIDGCRTSGGLPSTAAHSAPRSAASSPVPTRPAAWTLTLRSSSPSSARASPGRAPSRTPPTVPPSPEPTIEST